MRTIEVFSMSNCGPCQMLKLAVKKAEVDITFKDVQSDGVEASQHKIRGVPTSLFMEDGVAVKTLVGFTSKSKTIDEMKEFLKNG
jgi:thiol-disulfide isomerase/thioredoxin